MLILLPLNQTNANLFLFGPFKLSFCVRSLPFFFFHQQLAYFVQDFNLLTLYRRAAECIDAEL